MGGEARNSTLNPKPFLQICLAELLFLLHSIELTPMNYEFPNLGGDAAKKSSLNWRFGEGAGLGAFVLVAGSSPL